MVLLEALPLDLRLQDALADRVCLEFVRQHKTVGPPHRSRESFFGFLVWVLSFRFCGANSTPPQVLLAPPGGAIGTSRGAICTTPNPRNPVEAASLTALIVESGLSFDEALIKQNFHAAHNSRTIHAAVCGQRVQRRIAAVGWIRIVAIGQHEENRFFGRSDILPDCPRECFETQIPLPKGGEASVRALASQVISSQVWSGHDGTAPH